MGKAKSCYSHMAQEAEAAQAVMALSDSANSQSVKEGRGVSDDNAAAPMLTNAMTAVSVDYALLKGIPIYKLSTRGRWMHRVLTLSRDKLAFFITHHQISKKNLRSDVASSLPIPIWTPSRGFRWGNDADRYVRHLDVSDIDAWEAGVIDTSNLESAQKSISQSQIDGELVTIFHHGYQISLSFRVPNKHNRKALLTALGALQRTYRLVVPWIAPEQLLLRYIYYDIDSDKDGMVSLREFRDICSRINLELKDDDKVFADCLRGSSNGKKSLAAKGGQKITGAETRQLLYSIMSKDSPATQLWDSLFGANTATIGPGQLREEFLLASQAEKNASTDDVELLLQSLKTLGYSKDVKSISKSEFAHFLYSQYNAAYDPRATQMPKNLTSPLSHYWVNTSHNTYLTGDQLQSQSSVEAYVKALHRGCKCLELDCWDGPDDKTFTPVVFHGHTLTSKITFKSICLVVNNYLMANPRTYPIILSLENHCSPPFQNTMATEMTEIFGKKLFVPTAAQTSGGRLPSPEELRGMVVVKGKRPPDQGDDDQGEGEKPEATIALDDSKDDSKDDDEVAKSSGSKTEKKAKIDPKLAKLTLFHGTKYKDFEKSIEQPPSHMHSIGETKITKILGKSKDNASLWRVYNDTHLTRTYPAGTRVDSSNYNPLVAWAMGCQLVALNFQTSDNPLLLNDGLFRQAGGCGYVAKPKSVLGGDQPKPLTLSISVLSAICLPKPKGAIDGEKVDPYIKLDLHDVLVTSDGKEEYASSSFTTSSVDNNGFCPVWNDANVTFEVRNPDVAMLFFRVVDDDYALDDNIASAAIPVSKLRKGYRSVMLYDDNNTRTSPFQSATLLVKIELLKDKLNEP
jgi:phosphatidylinositol phospholipase C, delta